MARKFPKSKSTSRKLGKKSPKFKIFAYCEGKNTEPEYLKCFARHHGNGLVEVEPVAPSGAPLTVVTKAVDGKRLLDAKEKTNSFDGLYEVWAVFDIDEHPNIPQAINKANGNNIHTAISNPCIEIWPLLHFTFHRADIHRHDLQNELAKYMPSYRADGSKIIDYELIKDKYILAKSRAKTLLNDHEATDVHTPFGNPSTTFYKLLDKILENGTPLKPKST